MVSIRRKKAARARAGVERDATQRRRNEWILAQNPGNCEKQQNFSYNFVLGVAKQAKIW